MKTTTKGRKFAAEPLQRDEIERLLAACTFGASGVRNRALIVLLYRAGLRVSEACNAKWCDMNGNQLRVVGKGNKPRIVALDAWTLTALDAWGARSGRRGYIFAKLSGNKPVSTTYVRALMQRLRGKAGLEKRCNPHSLRHTFASEIADEMPLTDVQSLLGHGSLVVTQRYVHRLNGNERALAAMAARS